MYPHTIAWNTLTRFASTLKEIVYYFGFCIYKMRAEGFTFSLLFLSRRNNKNNYRLQQGFRCVRSTNYQACVERNRR